MAFTEMLAASLVSPLLITRIVPIVFLLLGTYYAIVKIFKPVKVPKGLRLPPSPPGRSMLHGHGHLWDGTPLSQATNNQLVKWSDELGEVYHLQIDGKLWFVFSRPEAVKVREHCIHVTDRLLIRSGSL